MRVSKISASQEPNLDWDARINKGVVMMCSKDNYYQEFIIQGSEFREAKHNFLKKVTEYYEMQREPKVNIKEEDFEKK